MKLVVPAPLPEGAVFEVADPARRLDTDRWLRRTLRRQSRHLGLRRTWALETQTGFPMRARLFAGAPAQVWLAVEYRFFDLAAAVAMGAFPAGWFENHGERVIEALASARPDWQGDLLSLRDLYND